MLPENKIVHALWIGNSLSKLELLSIASFIAKGHTFHLWLYDAVPTALPTGVIVKDAAEIIPRERVFNYKFASKFGHGKGSYAGFSDIFRYKLLYEKGGWWVDMDVTCLQPLDFDTPYFFRSHHDLKVVGNVMKCPVGSLLMKQCYEEAIQTVDENNTDWLKPIEILNRHIELLDLVKYIHPDVSNEDRWHATSRFIWHSDPLPPHWYFIHWQNEEWRKNAVSKADFYRHSVLAKLMALYGLYQMPGPTFAKGVNTVRHSSYFRALENLLLADI
ncbi:MAG TPA: glycosyltransferase [Chitinophagales bacterium]|nr:glycosyltransferase [Chitinophagales bacterium]